MPMVIVKSERGPVMRIRTMRTRMETVYGVWPEVNTYIQEIVDEQFATKGARLGRPWRPLKPEYLARKLANGYPANILIITGDMKRSFRMLSMRGNTASFGSTDRKTKWHQYGTRKDGRRVNPPRPMLVLTPEIGLGIKDIVKRWVLGRG